MAQAVHIRGQPNPITQIAIGRTGANESMQIVFQVPINIWLPDGVKLVYGDMDASIAAAFKCCLPGACFADTELKADVIKALRNRTEQGRLEFKDAAQRDIAMPISFKGFGQAIDAMAKEKERPA